MLHSFCLTKQNILSKDEIQQAFKNVESRLSTLHFTFLLSRRSAEESGICIVLPKKNIKKATKRNLCRRIIKEFFRTNKDSLNQKSLIVLGKKSASKATKDELWQSIENFHKYLAQSL